MDLQDIESVAERLAKEFGTRPPKVKSGRVPRVMRLGIRGKFWGRRLRLVIGPAAERLEPDELEGELASGIAAFTLYRGFMTRVLLSIGVAFVCEMVVLALLADFARWAQDLVFYMGGAVWLALVLVHYRGWIYRADRKTLDVVGPGPLFAVLDAERRLSSNGWVYLWALPSADRRAERLAPALIGQG